MFGYVTPNSKALTESALSCYKAGYCGICRALKRHGLSGRAMLSYDMTFLYALLSALYEPETERGMMRCPVNPCKKMPYTHNRFSDYAADMNFMLGVYKLLDNWNDDKSLPALLGYRFEKKKLNKLNERYPVQASVIWNELQQLSEIEKQRTAPMDEAAACFGRLLGCVFSPEDDIWKPALYETGAALGRFIYMMDAYEDLPKDRRKGSYNPLLSVADAPDFDTLAYNLLTIPMSECTEAFETLPLDEGLETLRNILYAGVWGRFTKIREQRTNAAKGNDT